jgi:hypothetical protein
MFHTTSFFFLQSGKKVVINRAIMNGVEIEHFTNHTVAIMANFAAKNTIGP